MQQTSLSSTTCDVSSHAQSVRMPRLCVSALSGGGGKTLLSLGLTHALAAQGHTVKAFKKGPDYIDAAWLAMASGRPATNLDPYMLRAEQLKALFVHAMYKTQAQTGNPEVLGVIEGNRGLFDGMDVAGSCSTAELARMLACPIILSINCTKMTRTTAALVHGMTTFEPGLKFAGVVLNQVGTARQEDLLRKVVEEYTDVRVLGVLPRLKENPLPERHMGIASCGDALSSQARAVLETLGSLVGQHVNLDDVMAAARAADAAADVPKASTAAEAAEQFWSVTVPAQAGCAPAPDFAAPRPRIAYVRDSALWFYYEENLEALERAGADLVRLEIAGPNAGQWPVLRGSALQAAVGEIDGLYLGGGFPEDCAETLSVSPHLRELAAWADAGLPIYAECGGFMLLSQGIEREGTLWPMSGIFPVVAQFCPKPQGLGYVRGTVTAENPFYPQGMEILGHEFHYSRCRWEGPAPVHGMLLRKGQGMGQGDDVAGTGPDTPKKGQNIDGLLRKKVWASYTHIFAPAISCWASNFVAAARRFAMGAASRRSL